MTKRTDEPPAASAPAMAHRISAGLQALTDHVMTARVKDLDHYRTHGGVYVETDYIVEVTGATYFEPFCISKTYSQFRALARDLKDIAESLALSLTVQQQEQHSIHDDDNVSNNHSLAKACSMFFHLIESQPTEYLGKVSYSYVKGLAKQRQSVVDDVLRQLLEHFPSHLRESSGEVGWLVGNCLEEFLLTDHCESLSCRTSSHNNKLTSENNSGSSSIARNVLGQKQQPSAFSTPATDRSKSHWAIIDKKNISKGLSKVGSGLSTVTTGVGSGLSTVTSGVGTVVKKMDITGVFCPADEATTTPNLDAFTSPVLSRKDGAGVVRDSKLVPMTTKSRNTSEVAALDGATADDGIIMEESLDEQLCSPTPGKKMASRLRNATRMRLKPQNPTSMRFLMDNAQYIAGGVAILAIYHQLRARVTLFTIDGDFAIIAIIGAYLIGRHVGNDLTTSLPQSAAECQIDKTRALMKRSSVRMSVNAVSPSLNRFSMSPRHQQELLVEERVEEEYEDEDEIVDIMDSPLPMFPKGAKIGSHNNCWSVPDHEIFHVRGPKYLSDRKKVASGPFLFPTRGIDLFLTDTCPENVGSMSCVFGGHLRTMPTFIINFRLPWGVLIFYFEIPAKFVPFVRAGYEPDYDQSTLRLDDMEPSERAACRFLMGDLQHKNKSLKIVPVVVDGPWIVKNVVGGKPAIIGTKLPVNYVYAPPNDTQALYLEADLDITASSAARGILSVTRSYTEILTIDLGFVAQGNVADELPEQMLAACRIHGVDPLTAQQLPLQSTDLLSIHDADNESYSELNVVVE